MQLVIYALNDSEGNIYLKVTEKKKKHYIFTYHPIKRVGKESIYRAL